MIENAAAIATAISNAASIVAAEPAAPVTIYGTIPTWLMTIFSATGLGFVAKIYQLKRNGDTADRAAADKAEDVLTGHTATELASLRAQIARMGESYTAGLAAANDRYMAGMKAADDREEHCQEQVAGLRRQVDVLREEVAGLRRNSIQTTHSAMYLAAQPMPDDIDDLTARSAAAMDRKSNGD